MENARLDNAITAILRELTTQEKDAAVVYVASDPIPAGTTLELPKTRIKAERDTFLAFVDRDPAANWSHSARYLLLNVENDEVQSVEATLPPFSSNKTLRWRVAYKAASVPDALLAVGR